MSNSRQQKMYFVKIIIQAEGYEKDSYITVMAASPDEAKKEALLNEAHNTLIGEDGGWLEDDGTGFAYFAQDPIELSASEVAVFKKFGI